MFDKAGIQGIERGVHATDKRLRKGRSGEYGGALEGFYRLDPYQGHHTAPKRRPGGRKGHSRGMAAFASLAGFPVFSRGDWPWINHDLAA